MCGIVGGIGLKEWPINQLLQCLSHRGPDSDGYYTQDDIFLGHTRLSILDLSENGNQPMISGDGRFVIIYNGEIYNHWELRNELKEFKFKSTSDTETLLMDISNMELNSFKN